MDSLISLALNRKAQLVFEMDGSFLTFPLTSLTYEPDDFRFIGDFSPKRFMMLREFSDYVDHVPRGPILDLSADQQLSEVYADLVGGGEVQLASSVRSKEEERRYREAITYLYTLESDGTRSEKAPLVAYKQYRDAWFTLRIEINNRTVDANSLSDPDAKRRWIEVEEPQLKVQLSDLEREWASKGFRAEVDRELQVVDLLGGRTPAGTWGEWRNQLIPEIDRPVDPNTNQTFWPSGYSPSNVADTEGWSSFTLMGDAINSLANDAPAGLRGKLVDQADLDVERMSFECTSVRVDRPWFARQLFDARFWRFKEPSKILSSGDGLSSGLCPAYIAGAVLARNLSVTLKPNSDRNATALERLGTQKYLRIGSLILGTAVAAGPGKVLLKSLAAPMEATLPRGGTLRVERPGSAGVFRRTAARLPLGRTSGVEHGAVAAPARPYPQITAKRMELASFTTKVRPQIFPPTAPAPAVTTDKSIHVLAFICRALPRSPNPDPSLNWST